jgi:hypothetical protein
MLGKATSTKETEKGIVHTVPVLLTCGCRSMKDHLEGTVRKAGFVASFQWPREGMNFVKQKREKVETTQSDRMVYYTRIRPYVIEGRVYPKPDIRKKDGGRFEGLAYWRVPSRNKDYWKHIGSLMEPEWQIVK